MDAGIVVSIQPHKGYQDQIGSALAGSVSSSIVPVLCLARLVVANSPRLTRPGLFAYLGGCVL
jgi:hypothetical protein